MRRLQERPQAHPPTGGALVLYSGPPPQTLPVLRGDQIPTGKSSSTRTAGLPGFILQEAFLQKLLLEPTAPFLKPPALLFFSHDLCSSDTNAQEVSAPLKSHFP